MEHIIKNMEQGVVLSFAGLVEYQPGQIASRTLAQNSHHSITLFAFEKGEEISSHQSNGDAMVVALDGKGKITIGGQEHMISPGETIVMPAKVPHAVYGEERFKMLLIVAFPEATITQ